MAEFKYEITEHFGDLPENSSGWAKQLNKISWMERAPKYDLREWGPNRSKAGKGITFTEEELRELKKVIDREIAFLDEE